MIASKSIQMVFLIGSVLNNFGHTASPIDANEIRNTLANNLPGGLSLPELGEFDVVDGVEKIKDIIKKKCLEVSGNEDEFEQVSNAATALSTCIENLIDFSKINEEIEKAKPTGDLDLVFNKYCLRRHEGLTCLEKFSNSTNVCLTEDEINQKKIFMKVVNRISDFVCHENGNQIALFIAEEGPECFSSKQGQLINCFNQTFSKYIPNEVPTAENLPALTITQENCVDLKKYEDCVVNELEKCKESTPANLVEALFRFAKKETPCRK